MFNKFLHIIVGWFNRIFSKNQDLYDQRIIICKECKYKKRLLGEEYCSLCGCPLKSKLVVKDEFCYDNRW